MRSWYFLKKYSSKTQNAEKTAPKIPTAGYRVSMTPVSPNRDRRNAARSTKPFAAFFFLGASLSHAFMSGRSAEARDVRIAQATATKKILLFFMTTRYGIGAVSASSPTFTIPPITNAPQQKRIAAASRELLIGALPSFPASMIAGAAKAVFINAYKSAHPPSAADIGAKEPILPENSTKRSNSGTSSRFNKDIPFIPRCKKNMTMQIPEIDPIGNAVGNKASSPASIPAHGTKHTASRSVTATVFPRGTSAFIAPENPLYFLPSLRKNEHVRKYTMQESASAGR